MLRPWLVVVVLLGAAACARGPAVFVGGDDIEHIGPLPEPILAGFPDATDLQLTSLGYRYQRFGLFYLDIWRDRGEFVAYSGRSYVTLSAEQAEELGASVPWRYHFPPGLMIILAAIELAFITRSRRRLWVTASIGVGLLVFSLVLYVNGLDVEFIIPALLGAYHLLGSWAAVRQGQDAQGL
jgi:hypothetical protein